MALRTETDPAEERTVETDTADTPLYGPLTRESIDTFSVSSLRLPRAFIRAIALVKEAAASVNSRLNLLDAPLAQAIESAARSVQHEEYDVQFPIDLFQSGSGSGVHMNVSEVIAALATKNAGIPVDPVAHVNLGQSSNDVIPSAIHIAAALSLQRELFPAIDGLIKVIDIREEALMGSARNGRNHLTDAMPLTFGQELSGWGAQLRACRNRLEEVIPRLYTLAQGGTAVGTGVNAHAKFAKAFATTLSKLTRLPFQSSTNFYESVSSQDTAVELSGQLKTLAVCLMKISSDLRWMTSGPMSGLAEIELESRFPVKGGIHGTTAPFIPESAAMICAKVIGNDTTITMAGQSGNFQLNTMLPLIAYALHENIEILSSACQLLGERAIAGLQVKPVKSTDTVHKNPILATALNPLLGHDRAAEIARRAHREQRPVFDVAREMTDIPDDALERLLDPARLTGPGVRS